ncbi:MAG: class I SAM-dependent methyltransferase [Planctomycetes bacterium]|nr:class I SAM-dependent methyltransferase [Planctomycetota bacterium]
MKPRTKAAFPDGHFYSPVVDTADVVAREAEIWPAAPEILGIEWNREHHETVLGEYFPRHLPQYDYPETLPDTPDLDRFYTRNSQFSWLDSRSLFVLLSEWKPKRMVEVGSGYSTLLTADVSRRQFDRAMDFTCIEPYPRPFLRKGTLPGVTRLLQQRVEHVGLEPFLRLGAGDVLFIDSSHVAKTGSDVNFLFFEVLPRLAPGVRIHVHDIHLPREYPREWVIGENRSWNEQYVLRALLMYSTAFRVLFGCSWAFHTMPEAVRKALAHPRGVLYGGGSLWLERT